MRKIAVVFIVLFFAAQFAVAEERSAKVASPRGEEKVARIAEPKVQPKPIAAKPTAVQPAAAAPNLSEEERKKLEAEIERWRTESERNAQSLTDSDNTVLGLREQLKTMTRDRDRLGGMYVTAAKKYNNLLGRHGRLLKTKAPQSTSPKLSIYIAFGLVVALLTFLFGKAWGGRRHVERGPYLGPEETQREGGLM